MSKHLVAVPEVLPEPVAEAQVVKGAFVEYKVAGRTYPLYTHPTCKVCNCEQRQAIETMVALALPYAHIARRFEGYEISARNIADHTKKGHFPHQMATVRALIDARAGVKNNVEEIEGSLIDHLTFLQMTVQQAAQRALSGEETPTIQDGLRASFGLIKHEEIAGAQASDLVWQHSFNIMYQGLREIMSPEQFALFERSVGPKLQQIWQPSREALEVAATEKD